MPIKPKEFASKFIFYLLAELKRLEMILQRSGKIPQLTHGFTAPDQADKNTTVILQPARTVKCCRSIQQTGVWLFKEVST